MGILSDFVTEIKDLDAFSYEKYKCSSLDLKLKKIELLNRYYRVKYGNIPKLPVFIDIDDVTLDTTVHAKELLYTKHGIDFDTRDRGNLEEQRIIARFFKSIDWHTLLRDSSQINRSLEFIRLFNESSLFSPTMYSAISSDAERIEKVAYFSEIIPEIPLKFTHSHTPKECSNNNSILIDDDNFNLYSWRGYPIHFDSNIPSDFPTINDLGELYYLFHRKPDNPDALEFRYGLYDGLIKSNDKTKKIVWEKRKSND